MSRTYRKHKTNRYRSRDTYSEVQYINRQLEYWHRNPTRIVKIKKTDDEYERDVAKAEAEYNKELKTYAAWNSMSIQDAADARTMTPWGGWRWAVRRPYVNVYRYEFVDITKAEVIAEAKTEFAKRGRDGRWSETKANKGFKKDAKKLMRRGNKRFAHKVLRDDDWENEALPTRKECKQHIWDWW